MKSVELRRIWILLLGVYTAAFMLRYVMVRPSFEEGQRVRITGQVAEQPRIVNGNQLLVIGGIRVYEERFPEYHYGDRIIAEGEMARGRAGWYLKDPTLKVDSSLDNLKGWSNTLLVLRRKVLELYAKYLPEPHNALLIGIVLGTKSSLDSSFFEALKTTGTLHIVVASGMNITIFAGGILKILSPIFGRRRAIIPALVGVLIYVILVGFQPPIVRAAVMGSIAFAALAWGRAFDAWRALFLSAGLLLLLNPMWLFDVGFQLSFAATAGMLAFTQRISTSRPLLLVPRFIRGDLATTLGAQLAVSPILLFSFGQVSLISPLVNALLLWSIPFIMGGGMIIAITGLLFEPAGQLLSWFIYLPLEYFVRVIAIFSNFQLPFAN